MVPLRKYSAVAQDQAHRFGPGPVRVEEYSTYRGGHGLRSRLSHAAHGHAQVLGLYYYDNAARLEYVHERVSDLARHPFLDLGPACVQVPQPGQLGQPGDLPLFVRYVPDMGQPEERQEVVLAGAVELDVPDHDHLVVTGIEHRREFVFGALPE